MAASVAHGQSGVTVEVDQFGVGSRFRQGDIAALRLKLTSNLAQPTMVWVQWQVPNVDGDIGEYGRSLTLTPNQSSLAWLYAPLPPEVSMNAVWTVRVFEEKDGVRRSEIGGDRISPVPSTSSMFSQQAGAQIVEIGSSMIAVIGQSRLGLDHYAAKNPGGMSRLMRPVSAHEDTVIASGIRPTELPDRWFGLLPFEAVAWAGDKEYPQNLSVDQADALREYVRRGGHLIISLPASGSQWGLGAIGQTQLEDLLPCRTPGVLPRTDVAVKLDELVEVLSKHHGVSKLVGARRQPEFSIRVFKDLRPPSDFNVIDNHYEPLIALPDGRVIAIQRQFGFGRITVIGIDLADGRLGGLGLPQADAFWNRILGRRSDTPTAPELTEIQKADRLNQMTMQENRLGSGPLVAAVLNMEGKAGAGLLMALLLFVVYWLLAGPVGFALLKYHGQAKHAWLAFAACAALFTVIAWGGVSLFPKRLEINHVTFLDHVARTPDDPRTQEPQYQRAVSFFSVYLPHYGSAPVSIASLPDQRDLLTSWIPPGPPTNPFPNIDRYRVDVGRSPASFAVPARSTATQFCAHWLGSLDSKWGGMLRVDPADPIRVQLDAAGNEQSLQGTIINELPGTLHDVTLFWVKSNRFARPRYAQTGGQDQEWVAVGGLQLNTTFAWRLSATSPWDAGTSKDISTLGREDILTNLFQKRYIEHFAQRDRAGVAAITNINDQDRRNYLEMLGFFGQLNPPEYLKQPNTNSGEGGVAFQRELGRELDLSAWFSRPCLIIMGFLDGAPCPVPLRIDGDDQPPVNNSLTIVRWVYPLPLNEKLAFRTAVEAPTPESERQ